MILYVLMVYSTLHRVMLDVLNLHLLETLVLRYGRNSDVKQVTFPGTYIL